MRILFLLMGALSLGEVARAQEPVSWNYSVKKIADKTYEIHLTATIAAPWHIYSKFTPDGGPIATTVEFGKNPLVVLEGTVKEQGKLIQRREEVFGVDVKYYEGTVDLVQLVRLKSKVKTTVSGVVNFMVCNDKECLPPKKVGFKVEVR